MNNPPTEQSSIASLSGDNSAPVFLSLAGEQTSMNHEVDESCHLCEQFTT